MSDEPVTAGNAGIAAAAQPLAPMQVPIGANGLILLLREPASLPLPRHCDVYSRALHCSDIHV